MKQKHYGTEGEVERNKMFIMNGSCNIKLICYLNLFQLLVHILDSLMVDNAVIKLTSHCYGGNVCASGSVVSLLPKIQE